MTSRRINRAGARHMHFRALAREIAESSKDFYARGWVLGTSGNFSAVVGHEPLRLAITASGLDKGKIKPSQITEIDAAANVLRGAPLKASAETLIHLAIVRERGAGAVLHTHSTWSTVLSEAYASQGAVVLEGYEMLKGLEGIHTHQHTERLPIVENSQNMEELSAEIAVLLRKQPEMHGLLIRKHGLYTWGANLRDARRHVEIIEFLMEVLVRSGSAANQG